MANQILWHGTKEASDELSQAIGRNCSCEFVMYGIRQAICSAHKMWEEDQRALDGLLFVKGMVERLLREEFQIPNSETQDIKTAEGIWGEDQQPFVDGNLSDR